MDSRLKKLLYTTSALVGFSLVPQIAHADPVSASIIISSAVSAAGTALMTTGVSVFSYATLKHLHFTQHQVLLSMHLLQNHQCLISMD